MNQAFNELYTTIKEGRYAEIGGMLSRVSIDIENEKGQTVAMKCVEEGNIDVLQILYGQFGASPFRIVEALIRASERSPSFKKIARYWINNYHVNPLAAACGYAFNGDQIAAELVFEQYRELERSSLLPLEYCWKAMASSALQGNQMGYFHL